MKHIASGIIVCIIISCSYGVAAHAADVFVIHGSEARLVSTAPTPGVTLLRGEPAGFGEQAAEEQGIAATGDPTPAASEFITGGRPLWRIDHATGRVVGCWLRGSANRQVVCSNL